MCGLGREGMWPTPVPRIDRICIMVEVLGSESVHYNKVRLVSLANVSNYKLKLST